MLTIDCETKSEADLLKVGAWAYSEHPTTEVICVCWGVGSQPIQEWWPGKNPTDDIPPDLAEAIAIGTLIEAHNVAFEYSIWANILHKRYGWPMPTIKQLRDTMATACYFALPAGLDELLKVLGYPGKNPDGKRLISKYSKLHLKTAKREIPPEDFRKFVEYCKDDVRGEQSVSDDLGDLPQIEMDNFHLDLEMNIAGIRLDKPSLEVARMIADQRSAKLAEKFKLITGLVPGANVAFKHWLGAHGVVVDSVGADILEDVLKVIGPGPAREAIDLKLQVGKASLKKLDAMLRQSGKDGRARFQTRYHGAATGRPTGSGFQVLNMTKNDEDADPVEVMEDINYGNADWLDLKYGDAMQIISKSMRHFIKVDDGKKLTAGDYSSIEAIVLACLAREEWKIEAFKNGVEIYSLTADKIYKLAPGTVTKKTHPKERQDGKIGELAFGYEGGVGAWLNFDNSGRHTEEGINKIKDGWRAEHPQTKKFWRGLSDASIEAVLFPGKETGYNDIAFQTVDEWLTMILPDGKRIWYRDPEVRSMRPHWHSPETRVECAVGECECGFLPHLTYKAQKFGQWRRVGTYGGKLTENACQAVSRQILYPALKRIRAAGYRPILSVYDEIVSEDPLDFGSDAEFKGLMEIRPDFCKSWPIKAEVWSGGRYKK